MAEVLQIKGWISMVYSFVMKLLVN